MSAIAIAIAIAAAPAKPRLLHKEAQRAGAPHGNIALNVSAAVASSANSDAGLTVHLPQRRVLLGSGGLSVLPDRRVRCAKERVNLVVRRLRRDRA